jgi:hypothetical protein
MGQPGLNPNAPSFQSFWNLAFLTNFQQQGPQGQKRAPSAQFGSSTDQGQSPIYVVSRQYVPQ